MEREHSRHSTVIPSWCIGGKCRNRRSERNEERYICQFRVARSVPSSETCRSPLSDENRNDLSLDSTGVRRVEGDKAVAMNLGVPRFKVTPEGVLETNGELAAFYMLLHDLGGV